MAGSSLFRWHQFSLSGSCMSPEQSTPWSHCRSAGYRSASLINLPHFFCEEYFSVISKPVAVEDRQGVKRRSLPVPCCVGSSPGLGGSETCWKDSFSSRKNASARNVRADIRENSANGGYTRSKLAVFVSGGGSNFRALHIATLNNSIYGDIALVVSNNPGCGGCDYARENAIPVVTYPRSKKAPEGLSEVDLLEVLRSREIDFILLAGYLKLLPASIVGAFPRSVLNIHPALLPSFGGKGYYGLKLHETVIKSGTRYSGATIHFVDEQFDSGAILAQRVVPVLSDDTPQDLAARILKVEHILYPEAVAALCEDRIFWRKDGVPLIRKSWDGAEYY